MISLGRNDNSSLLIHLQLNSKYKPKIFLLTPYVNYIPVYDSIGKKKLLKCKFLGTLKPSTGDACPVKENDYLCLFGDAFCCDKGCEPANRCDCINGTFSCASNKNPNPCIGTALCPVQKPNDGSTCTMSDNARCSYLDSTSSSTCAKVTDICQCENGLFTCLVNFVQPDTCLPVPAATSPPFEYTCPSGPVTTVQGSSCTLVADELCGYGKNCCPGVNDGVTFSTICFPEDICSCQNGVYSCTSSTNGAGSFPNVGCHQAGGMFTSFPSATPVS